MRWLGITHLKEYKIYYRINNDKLEVVYFIFQASNNKMLSSRPSNLALPCKCYTTQTGRKFRSISNVNGPGDRNIVCILGFFY